MKFSSFVVCLLLVLFTLTGCSEDAIVDSSQEQENASIQNYIQPVETTDQTKPDTLSTVDDYITAIMRVAGNISDISNCMVIGPHELRHEVEIVQRKLDVAVSNGDVDAINLLNDEAKALFDRASQNCNGLKTIEKISAKMFAKFPELRQLEKSELHELLLGKSIKNKTGKCQEKCAAAAVAETAAIHIAASFGLAACVSSTVGFPVCAAGVMSVKYLALTAVMLHLSSCMDSCPKGEN